MGMTIRCQYEYLTFALGISERIPTESLQGLIMAQSLTEQGIAGIDWRAGHGPFTEIYMDN